MAHIINFNQAKLEQQQAQMSESFYNMYLAWYDLFMHFFVYPVVAAVETVKQRKIVVVK